MTDTLLEGTKSKKGDVTVHIIGFWSWVGQPRYLAQWFGFLRHVQFQKSLSSLIHLIGIQEVLGSRSISNWCSMYPPKPWVKTYIQMLGVDPIQYLIHIHFSKVRWQSGSVDACGPSLFPTPFLWILVTTKIWKGITYISPYTSTDLDCNKLLCKKGYNRWACRDGCTERKGQILQTGHDLLGS